MTNHLKPIEECKLWDILSWPSLEELAAQYCGNPKTDPAGAMAEKLIHLGSKPGNEDVEYFHRLGKRWIGTGDDPTRRQQAGELALMLKADPERLIDYVAYKWGWFKRVSRPRP
jgi:hypothetical protein